MTNPSTQEFDSLTGMLPAAADGLHHLLWALADTKLLLGYHYGEWTFGTPELEAAVASCSLSQSELGHVRLLHAVLRKHWDEDPDAAVEQREPGGFANIAYLDEAVRDWPACVAMNAVVDLAATRTLAALSGSTFKPLRMSVEKMLDEERHHAHHGRGWFRTLGRQGGDAAEHLREATQRALASAAMWFGPADHPEDAALVAAGITTERSQDLFAGLKNDVAEMAREAGVSVPAAPAPSFDGWDSRTRRTGGSGPAEDILYHLRGAANAIFKLGE
jgi:phenylacetate-CoA oxygenase PaaI subunit